MRPPGLRSSRQCLPPFFFLPLRELTLDRLCRIAIGYVIAYASFIPWIARQRRQLREDPGSVQPESRLWWLLFSASLPLLSLWVIAHWVTTAVPLEPIGLFGFAWTSVGPPNVPWIAPLIFATLIAIANVSVHLLCSHLPLLALLFAFGARLMVFRVVLDIHGHDRLHDSGAHISTSTCILIVDWTLMGALQAYGPYAASATGGNGFARDFLAGIAALYSVPRTCPSPSSLPLHPKLTSDVLNTQYTTTSAAPTRSNGRPPCSGSSRCW